MGGFSSINGKFGSSAGGQLDSTKTQLGKVGTTQPVTPTLPVYELFPNQNVTGSRTGPFGTSSSHIGKFPMPPSAGSSQIDPAKTQPGKVGTTQPVTPTLPVIPDIVAGRNRLEDPRFAANPIGHNETFGTSQMDPRFGPMPFSNPFGGFGGFGGLGFGMNPFNQMANSAFNRFGGFQGGNPFIQQFNPRPNPFAIDTQGFGQGDGSGMDLWDIIRDLANETIRRRGLGEL